MSGFKVLLHLRVQLQEAHYCQLIRENEGWTTILVTIGPIPF